MTYDPEYYQKHKEAFKASYDKWRLGKGREKFYAGLRKYQAENKEKISEINKRYYIKNRDKVLARNHKYQEAHAEQIKAWYHSLEGFIYKQWYNMQQRCKGQNPVCAHLTKGNECLSRKEYTELALNSPEYLALYENYKKSGFKRKLVPTPNRIDGTLGYTVDNIEFITQSENASLPKSF